MTAYELLIAWYLACDPSVRCSVASEGTFMTTFEIASAWLQAPSVELVEVLNVSNPDFISVVNACQRHLVLTATVLPHLLLDIGPDFVVLGEKVAIAEDIETVFGA